METLGQHNRLALGTVQFGMPYGVANVTGRVSHEEVNNIIHIARSFGIDTLDTAIAYGESESTIGQIGISSWRIISKLPALPDDCNDVIGWAKKQTSGSLGRLGVNRLDGLLLHRPGQLLEQRGRLLLTALEELKSEGVVGKIGVSIYDPDELSPLFDIKTFDIVQAPLSILDRRLLKSGWASQLNDSGVEIHTRSAFLQGLLLMPSHVRPEKFKPWDTLWRAWESWLSYSGLEPLEACIRFSLSVKEVDRVIVGTDSSAQLLQILIASEGSLDDLPDFGQTSDLDFLINPGLWNQL